MEPLGAAGEREEDGVPCGQVKQEGQEVGEREDDSPSRPRRSIACAGAGRRESPRVLRSARERSSRSSPKVDQTFAKLPDFPALDSRASTGTGDAD